MATTANSWQTPGASDPGRYTKIHGKLLTLHQRGNGVDVEALHDRIPLQ